MVKPGKKKKKFIGKHEEQVTFHLVHRSQRDPLAADETAPQHVLLPAKPEPSTKRKEEQHKYGIFFDDDYNYLQHLRDVSSIDHVELSESGTRTEPVVKNDEASLLLPSSVFQSSVEEGVGLLNKAAPVSGPRVDWDPDIVAALDDDFDFDNPENCLDDDFFITANAVGDDDPEKITDDEDCDSDFNDSGSNEGQFSPDEFKFDDEETGSKFTDYSLSSSVIRRNEGLKMLDSQFETLYEQYDEDDIGALDMEEITGHITMESERFKQILEEYEAKKKQESEKMKLNEDVCVNILEGESSDEEGLTKMVIEESTTEKWDCESILSTYSNLYNHPKLITEPSQKPQRIRIPNSAGFPVDELRSKKLTLRNLQLLDKRDSKCGGDDVKSVVSQSTANASMRKKGETAEERKERKEAVKELRRERRKEKKANKLAFKGEKKQQEKIMLNVQQNMHRIKLS